LLVQVTACPNPEAVFSHKQTVVAPDMSWRYFIGTSEPSADWRKLSFDDSVWEESTGGIWYVDSDKGTGIEPTISVYLRRAFMIADPNQLLSIDLYMDYEDGFVAYINDVEIARSKGMRGTHPRHDHMSSALHEVQPYRGRIPERFPVDLDAVRAGANVLAIQVHKAREPSQSLTSNAYLIVESKDPEQPGRWSPEWLLNPLEDKGSNLPIVIITTEQRGAIPDEPKVTGRMGIIDNGEGRRNYLSDHYNVYEGFIGIEVRGFSSQNWDKKSYGLETRDESGNRLNVPLLGLPMESDWVLNASYFDRTFIRIPLAHQLSQSMGNYSSRTVHCELVLDGHYQGLYIFMERIKRDRNRVNVSRLSPIDVMGDAVTGGYIYEYGARGVTIDEELGLVYPRADQAQPEQVAYIRSYIDRFWQVMQGSDYADPATGYPALIDVGSFVDEVIMQELAKNVDAYRFSSYFHKDRSAKLRAGPIWDFDQSFGNSEFRQGNAVHGWMVRHHELFWKVLFEDDEFQRLLKERWFALRRGPFQTDAVLAIVDEMAQELNEAQERNFKFWPILGVFTWREAPPLVGDVSYQQEVDYLKSWIRRRMRWLDFYVENASATSSG
jgi:hypothetical protein